MESVVTEGTFEQLIPPLREVQVNKHIANDRHTVHIYVLV